MALRELMMTFAAQIGLGQIELEDDGGASFVFGDDLSVDVIADESGNGFDAIASVASLPLEDREAAFAELLEANISSPTGGGACLGIDRQRDEIVLRQHFPTADLSIDVFDRELTSFANSLRFWRLRCECGHLASSDDDIEDDQSPHHFSRLRV